MVAPKKAFRCLKSTYPAIALKDAVLNLCVKNGVDYQFVMHLVAKNDSISLCKLFHVSENPPSPASAPGAPPRPGLGHPPPSPPQTLSEPGQPYPPQAGDRPGERGFVRRLCGPNKQQEQYPCWIAPSGSRYNFVSAKLLQRFSDLYPGDPCDPEQVPDPNGIGVVVPDRKIQLNWSRGHLRTTHHNKFLVLDGSSKPELLLGFELCKPSSSDLTTRSYMNVARFPGC